MVSAAGGDVNAAWRRGPEPSFVKMRNAVQSRETRDTNNITNI